MADRPVLKVNILFTTASCYLSLTYCGLTPNNQQWFLKHLFIIKIDLEESMCAVHVQGVCVNVCVLPVVRVPQQQSLAACTAV